VSKTFTASGKRAESELNKHPSWTGCDSEGGGTTRLPDVGNYFTNWHAVTFQKYWTFRINKLQGTPQVTLWIWPLILYWFHTARLQIVLSFVLFSNLLRISSFSHVHIYYCNLCFSYWNLLSSSLLSKNVKIKIYRTIILPCCFIWVWNLVAHIEGGT
jgi:hypothetical protein